MDTNPSGIFHEVTVIFSPALRSGDAHLHCAPNAVRCKCCKDDRHLKISSIFHSYHALPEKVSKNPLCPP